jgi:hypothetical protein
MFRWSHTWPAYRTYRSYLDEAVGLDHYIVGFAVCGSIRWEDGSVDSMKGGREVEHGSGIAVVHCGSKSQSSLR